MGFLYFYRNLCFPSRFYCLSLRKRCGRRASSAAATSNLADSPRSGNLKHKVPLSDSVWAVFRTQLRAKNAMLANRPEEHTAIDFYHQPAIDRSSTLTVAYDHVAVSHMHKSRREPLWYSVAFWLGFKAGKVGATEASSTAAHLDPHRIDAKLRWRPSQVPAFEHSLFFLSLTSNFLKTRKDFGTVAASFVNRINRDWCAGSLPKPTFLPRSPLLAHLPFYGVLGTLVLEWRQISTRRAVLDDRPTHSLSMSPPGSSWERLSLGRIS